MSISICDAYVVLYNSYAYYGLSYFIKVSVREPGLPAVVGGINRRVFAYKCEIVTHNP
jgi:hypothetical protein